MSEHPEFVEACALYASGCISDERLKQLDQHLEGCLACRHALEEFQEIVSMGLPALAPDFAALPKEGETRSQSRLLTRIENQIAAQRPRSAARTLLPYAAAILFSVSIGLYVGVRRSASGSEPILRQAQARANSLEAKLSEERRIFGSNLCESDRRIGTLTAEVHSQLEKIASLKKQGRKLAESAEEARAESAASDAERSGIERKLVDLQASLDANQKALDSARSERAPLVADLERRLGEATDVLKDRDQTIQEQRDLLAYDRDIRDLIGARDLYVAEVNDIDRDAQTKTPFGRVFYTKGKSLIMYAYDLDREPGVKRAAAFQAWGRRGPDFEQALPLGILYLDSSSNRRWVLRFDNPATIAKIDAVFITVEPKGGSQRPSGKPLLFAYLKVEPNHP